MISHVSLGVVDLGRSGSFYDTVFGPLGYVRYAETKPSELAYGPPGEALFWLYEVVPANDLASPGTHIAFQAANRDAVHEATSAAKHLGSQFTREPGAHPDIAPDYYGAVFFDPDGHKLEIVVEASA